jgi:tRNA nucleotidyltransferase (CCA-adding enzyme)
VSRDPNQYGDRPGSISRRPLGGVNELAADPYIQAISRTIRACCGASVNLWLVGGAVRDVVSGSSPREYDVVVVGNAISVARQLVAEGAELVAVHDAFGTADVILQDDTLGRIRLDLATARSETYSHPGALPDVAPVEDIAIDLARRDITINALAWQMLPVSGVDIVDPYGGMHDLATGRVRILHDASLVDDPSRIFRIARYAARYGDVDDHTLRLIHDAVSSDALHTISAARRWQELDRVLHEPDPAYVTSSMRLLDEWRVLGSVLPPGAHHTVAVPGWNGAGSITEDRIDDASSYAVARWASLFVRVNQYAVRRWLADAGVEAAYARRVRMLAVLQERFEQGQPVHELLQIDRDILALAVATWHPEIAGTWCDLWDNARRLITGADLRARGLDAGPRLGAVLDAVRADILRGRVLTRTQAIELAERAIADHTGGCSHEQPG